MRLHFIVLTTLLALSACSEKPPSPRMKVGDPYVINGVTYYPEYRSNYDKTGMGSWYGPGFHGKKTASGERFDENDLTAAHPTLQMPSLVRVTNVKNGKSVIARINDRGPFAKGRIIDLSRGTAERIGMHSTMKVRVQYLPKETMEYIAEWERTGRPGDMFALNDHVDDMGARVKVANRLEEAPEPKSHGSFFVSEAYADEADKSISSNAISSNDLPAPGKASKAAAPISDPKPVVLSKPIYESEPESVPFSRGPSVPEPQEPSSKTPFKEQDVQKASSDVLIGGYFIQAGTFSKKENGEKLVAQLSGISDARMDEIDRSGSSLWRVRVGPFANKSAANEVLPTVQHIVPDARITHQ